MFSIKKISAFSIVFSCLALSHAAEANVVFASAAYSAGEPQNLAFYSGPFIPTGIFPTAIGESFTLGSATNITGMDFYLDGFNTNQTINVFFHRLTDNPSINTPIYSQSFNFLQYSRTADVLPASAGNITDNINVTFSNPFTLQAGNYGVFWSGPNGDVSVSRFGPGPSSSASSNSANQFTDFENTQIQVNADGLGIGFTGYASGMRLFGSQAQISVVPEPEIYFLFAIGLPLIFAASRRKKSQQC